MAPTEPDVSKLVPKILSTIESLIENAGKANGDAALQYAQAAAALLNTKLGEMVGNRAMHVALPPERR
jgi:hypothetical protein